MTDIETRLRDTYATVLDAVAPADRSDELPQPVAGLRPLRRRVRPALAFAAAAVVTLAAVGAVALLGPGRSGPETVVAAAEVTAGDIASLLEVRFPDAAVVAAGGAGGRPVVAAATDRGDIVIRGYVSPTEWEELAPLPWDTSRGSEANRVIAAGSDGDTFAVLLDDQLTGGFAGENYYTLRIMGSDLTWSRYALSWTEPDWGNPAAQRSRHVEDLSVGDGRIVVVITEHPDPDPEELERFLRDEGRIPEDQDMTAVTEYGPDGIGVQLSGGSTIRFPLPELGINSAWGYPQTEIWRTNADGSTTGIPFDENVPGSPRATITAAAIVGDRLYVGGERRNAAFLAVSDISTSLIEPFMEIELSGLDTNAIGRAERVSTLRAHDDVVYAAVVGTTGSTVLRVIDTAPSRSSFLGFAGSIAEIAIDADRLTAVQYPDVALVSFPLEGATAETTRLIEWGVDDRHPTRIVPTEEGIVALPQAGSDPSSFGPDGTVWLIRRRPSS